MKARIVLGIAACAAACAALSASANENVSWFSGAAANDELTQNQATWTTPTSGVTVSGSTITLENDSDTMLSLAPTAASPALNDGLVTIQATAVLTPCEGELEAVTGAHAGFATKTDGTTTNYCGFVNGNWVDLTGATPPSTDGVVGSTTFKIVIDYRTGKAKFYVVVGTTDTQLSAATGGATEFDIASGTTALANVAAFGTGSLTSIGAAYEKAVCAVGTAKYGSLAEAIAAGGTAATILDVTASGIGESATSTANGLPIAVCKALGIDVAAENPSAVAIVPVAADADSSNVTLQLDPAVQVADGVAVTFAVKQGGTAVQGSPFASGAIKVPLQAGTYTIEPAGVAAAAQSGN